MASVSSTFGTVTTVSTALDAICEIDLLGTIGILGTKTRNSIPLAVEKAATSFGTIQSL